MHCTVAIATADRREILSRVLSSLVRQTRSPDLVVVCPARDDHLEPEVLQALPFPTTVVWPRGQGLPHQRNAILRSLETPELILFLDDDFLMADDFLQRCEQAFLERPEAVMLTGTVIADGAQGAGIDFDEAEARLRADVPPSREKVVPVYNCYGCNMAFRADVARRHGIEFDETLPLYGWLEDVDFSRQMARFGAILKTSACRGVHLGTKKGRTSGRRLGYSQVANPAYLARKRTLSVSRAVTQFARNFAANLTRAPWPEPWIDRRGRLEGNLLALADLMRGAVDPRKITSI